MFFMGVGYSDFCHLQGDYDEEYGRVAKRPRASEFIHEEAEETDEGEDDEEEEVEEGYAELVDTNAPYELPVDEDINKARSLNIHQLLAEESEDKLEEYYRQKYATTSSARLETIVCGVLLCGGIGGLGTDLCDS